MSDSFDNPYAAPATSGEHVALPDEEQLAGRGTRLLSAIIDTLLMLIVLLPFMFATGYLDRAMTQQVEVAEMLLQTAAGFLLFFVLHGYTLATRGQSLGKLILGIQIVDQDSQQILPIGRLIGLRILPIWIASLIPFVGGIVSLVDALMIFTDRRQCLHDRIARTIVIIKPRT